MKRHIKSWIGTFLFRSGLHRRLLRDRAVIVAFHRVRDDLAGNPISCTTAEFRAYCEFFAQHFEVIALAQLLERMRKGQDVGGTLVITFDDGYRDNLETAAPILLELGLPATFFIASDLIETETVPWWDAERNVRTEWMSWAQVRELRAHGFDIGAHTRQHVDLGVVVGEEAAGEIAGSRWRLERELGASVRHFSYPYGRAHQLTEENREQVRAAGFDCCLSCFGGTVRPGDDLFRLLRTPVSPWHISPAQLGLELALDAR